jgi:hypothetical protein
MALAEIRSGHVESFGLLGLGSSGEPRGARTHDALTRRHLAPSGVAHTRQGSERRSVTVCKSARSRLILADRRIAGP